jgi:hypothetical protein
LIYISQKKSVPWPLVCLTEDENLLKYRQTWAVVAGKVMTDPVWYFYLFWGAKNDPINKHIVL